MQLILRLEKERKWKYTDLVFNGSKVIVTAWVETWRRVWGDGENIFRGPNFRMTFFRENVYKSKISDDPFLVIDRILSVFRLSLRIQ